MERVTGFRAVSSGWQPLLLKLHGSTDWYEKQGSGEAVKLRHPMPLFGKASLKVQSGQELVASLILPSREKRFTMAPYFRLSQAFLNAADQCEMAIFIGTSLRDPHIRRAALDCSKDRPTFVVNRSLSEDPQIAQIPHIHQTASPFLASTLPHGLGSDDPAQTLARNQTDESSVESLLPFLITSSDTSLPPERRCQSIERLEATAASISSRVVEGLVRDDDSMVARFALGLIALLQRPLELLRAAESENPHVQDQQYMEELALLKEILGASGE